MSIGQLLNTLEARLPELEWRMRSLNLHILEQALPPGLFQPRIELTPALCVQEIKQNIAALASQDSEPCAFFLANTIHKKINVLIDLCKTAATKQPREKIHSLITGIQTRKQHIEMLESDIAALEIQKTALETRAKQVIQPSVLLKLQVELGEIEKKITLIVEEKQRVMKDF